MEEVLALTLATVPVLAQTADPNVGDGGSWGWLALLGMTAFAGVAALRHHRRHHDRSDAIPHHVVRDDIARNQQRS